MNFKAIFSNKINLALLILVILILILITNKKTNFMQATGAKKLPKDHKPDEVGIAHFKTWEGYRTKAYKDSAGLWTTGIGHLIRRPKEDHLIRKILTNAEVMDLFYADIKKAHNVVVSKISVPISQGLYNALLSLAYNTGTLYSSIVKLVLADDMKGLKARWKTTAITVNQGKKRIQGLVNRRNSEIKLF